MTHDFHELSDVQITKKIQKNDEHSSELIGELVERHSGIYHKIINRYFPSGGGRHGGLLIDRDFILDSKEFIIYESAKGYNPKKKTKFSTHVGNCARYFCLNYINKNKNYVHVEDKDYENLCVDYEAEQNIYAEIDKVLLSQITDIIQLMPDKRIWKIFSMRYLSCEGNKVTPWSKIYENIPPAKKKKKGRHLTIQGCINLHDKAIRQIRRTLKAKKIGFEQDAKI